MAAALAKALRRRIVATVEEGTSRRAAAARFWVSDSCAIWLMQRWQRTERLAPARMGARRKTSLHGHAAQPRSSPAARTAWGRKRQDERRRERRLPPKRNAR